MRKVALYDTLAGDYDRFVNWEGRLAHELPFLDRILAERRVEHILDAACGTGHHAMALAQSGYSVVGTDLSTAMIARARENAAGSGADVSFQVAGFGELGKLGKTFDAVLCLGNSLPHVPSKAAVDAALADFASVLHPGGLLVLQNRNFDKVWAEHERFMAPQSHREGDHEWLFVRFYDFHESTITFNMIRLRCTGEQWEQTVESTELRPLFRDELATALAKAGFEDMVYYGGCDGSTFDTEASGDLIVVATKAGGHSPKARS